MRPIAIITASLLVSASIAALAVSPALADPAPPAQVQAGLLTSKEASAIGGANVRFTSLATSCLERSISPGAAAHTRCDRTFLGRSPRNVSSVTIGASLESYASPEEAAAALAQHASDAHGVTTATPTEVVVRFMSDGHVNSVQVSAVSGATLSRVECAKVPRASRSVLTACARKGAQAQLARSAN